MRKLIALVFLTASLANATVRYVNNNSPCPGNGTSSSPYCNIQNAFNVAVAGDDIRIQFGTGVYDQQATTVSAGTSTSPIIVESDNAAQQPILRFTGNGSNNAMLHINGHSYWTLQNLTFDGSGVFTSAFAVWVSGPSWTTGPDTVGVKILSNTFRNWGGTEAQDQAAYNNGQVSMEALHVSGGYAPPAGAYTINGILIQNNVFDADRLIALSMVSTKNSLVQNNEFKNLTCGVQTSGGTAQAVVTDGIHIISGTIGGGSGDVYKSNSFHNFASSCGLTQGAGGYTEKEALHCDMGPGSGTVDSNLVYNIGPPGPAIHIEYQCYGWLVKNNIVHDVGGDALYHNPGSTTGSNNKYINNTVYNAGGWGMTLYSGNAVVENNIIDNSAAYQIRVIGNGKTQGGLTIDYNDYWDNSGGARVGTWDPSNYNFSNWKATCSCDAHSINANPQFVNPPTDLSLQSTSPALGSGLGGVTMGAMGASLVAPPTGLTATVQ